MSLFIFEVRPKSETCPVNKHVRTFEINLEKRETNRRQMRNGKVSQIKKRARKNQYYSKEFKAKSYLFSIKASVCACFQSPDQQISLPTFCINLNKYRPGMRWWVPGPSSPKAPAVERFWIPSVHLKYSIIYGKKINNIRSCSLRVQTLKCITHKSYYLQLGNST